MVHGHREVPLGLPSPRDGAGRRQRPLLRAGGPRPGEPDDRALPPDGPVIDNARSAILIGLLLAQARCIALPFATPPVALSVGGAARRGLPERLQGKSGPAVFRFDAGVRPFQLLEEWRRRRADLGFGY